MVPIRSLLRVAVPSCALLVVVAVCGRELTAPITQSTREGTSGTKATGPRADVAASVVLVGAGDIANCSLSGDEATAKLLDNIAGTVFTAGDNAYTGGTATQYKNCYGPTWGRHKARTRPTPGSHDYHTSGASGYFDYFGSAAGTKGQGYYSYDLGAWHIIALNSFVDVSSTSAQVKWLKADLAAHPVKCTLAYFYSTRFSSGWHGSDSKFQPLWQALYDGGAEVVMNGHDHDYERFAPQTPSGKADATRS
jgi:acid phosphatase type 7